MAVPVLGILFAKGNKTEIRKSRAVSTDQTFGQLLTGTTETELVRVDAFITRAHSFSSSVTRAPVEDGSNINDHVIRDARELTIEGLVSDHPVNLIAGLTAIAGAVGELLGQEPASTRSQTEARTLESLWQNKTELQIVTRLRTYENMVIEQLEWNESADVGEALSFRMRVIEIRKVTLQRVPASGLAAAAADIASGPVEAGRQAPKPKPKPTAQAVKSTTQATEMVDPAAVGSGFEPATAA